MSPNVVVKGIVAATAVVASLALPGDLLAQGKRNLGLTISSGEPKGYAFLLPVPPPKGRTYHVLVTLAPNDTADPPDEWTWYVKDSDAQLKSAATMKWYAQASCPDDLTLLQVIGPGGTLTQNPLSNPIWGNFSTQSFTVDTLKNVCTEWADDNACDPADPGCEVYRDFDLVGGIAPAAAADRLRLKASCTSGPLPTLDYAPKISLRCDRKP